MFNCFIVFSYLSLDDFIAKHLESKKVLSGYCLVFLMLQNKGSSFAIIYLNAV